MITPKEIPTKDLFENGYLLITGGIEPMHDDDSEVSHDAARCMIESAAKASLRDVYGEEYLKLSGIDAHFETAIVGRNDIKQIKISIECHSAKHFETVTERILLGWNILNGLSGTPYIGRCRSKSEAQAFLDPEWRGQL